MYKYSGPIAYGQRSVNYAGKLYNRRSQFLHLTNQVMTWGNLHQMMATAAMAQGQKQIQHWQAVLDSAGEGIWGIDREGKCTFVNRMALSTFGFSSEELVGSVIHDLVHHHYPDGRSFPASECPLSNVLSKNKALRQITDTMFRKDGSSFVAEISAQPVVVDGEVMGLVVIFRDVTERRQQQDELRKAYELAAQRTAELDAVIESMPHGVYIATHDNTVRCNHRARTMSGDRFPAEIHTLERALNGEASTEVAKAGGRWIRSMAEPIFLNGKILGGVAVNTDVTQTRQQEEALRKSEKLAAVGQLASSIAHEINNPLESITNLLYLMRHSESMKDVQEYARIAQEELTRVTEITVQTLRFHRQQSKPSQVDLAELLRTIMALYMGRLLVRDISVEMNLLSVPNVLCLEGEIRQVINNLVRNALDAMGTGGRMLIRLHSQTDGRSGIKGVRITVADTGEGISPEIRSHLFEPFQTTKEQTGTGLGLWVSKGIVEKHGGYIRTKTRRGAGHGTVFTVWLPCKGGISLTSATS
jgi:PAS domain S-box-containing protein